MSEHIDQLATALAKAQGEFGIAQKDKNNPFFKSKYADFESVVEASRPALAKYGLSVIQSPYIEEGTSYLITMLLHSSGQWIQSKAQHSPQKNDIQSLSSYNTYLKRMCYSSIVGVVTGEYDDDGEAAMHRHGPITINTIQLQALKEILAQFDAEKEARICKVYGINNLTEMLASDYAKTIDQLKSQLKK